MGEKCSAYEINYWQQVFITNGDELMGLARIWYKDHVIAKLNEKDNKIKELENKPPIEVIKEVEKIVEKEVMPDLSAGKLFVLFINKIFGAKNVQEKSDKDSGQKIL